MAVAPDGNPGLRPVPADATDETAQVTADLGARGCLAGTQQHGDRPARRRVIDVDRQEAALVVMGVEQRELLMAVNDIHRIVDVERHRCRWGRVAGTIEIDHHVHQADEVAQGWRILPTRDGRLRAQVPAAIRQAATGQLERWIEAQPIEVVGVFVAAGDGEDAGAQDIGQQMGDPVRITAIRDHSSEPLGDPEPTIGLGEQHDPAVGTDPSAVKGGGDLLAADGWKTERQKAIVGHGGGGAPRSRQRVGSATESYARSKAYDTPATPNPPRHEYDGLALKQLASAQVRGAN